MTGLRGLAALTVVAYHAGDMAGVDLVPRGYLAVDLFFVLSGFVLALSAGRDFAEAGWRAAPAFWARRLARILPLNLAVVLALCVANLAAHGGAGTPPGRAACNALALQGWGFCTTLNAPAWTLSFEWLAYAMFPAILAVALRGGRAGYALLAGASFAALACLAMHTGRGSLDSAQFGAPWSALRCLAGTALGAIACRLYLHPQASRSGAGDGPALGILAAGCAAAFAPRDLPLAALFAPAVLALATNRGAASRLLSHPAVHGLGEISFAIYLLHDPLLQREARLASAIWPGWHGAGAAWFGGLATATVVPPAWMAWRLVERPGRAALLRVLRRRAAHAR